MAGLLRARVPVVAQAELDQGGPGELGRRAEAAPFGIKAAGEAGDGLLNQGVGVEGGAGRQTLGVGQRFGQADLATDGLDQCVGLAQHLLAFGRPGRPEGFNHPAEGRHAVPLFGREVGAGVEGAAIGRAEHRHGPAAGSGEGLGGGHVERIEVGSFLAVDLDRNEPAGEVGGRLLVFETFVGHDVAPVAGGVPDGEKDGLVLVLGPLQGLVAPGVPLDRIVRMLAEVGAGFVRQVVHEVRCYGAPASGPACKAPDMELELHGKTALITGASRGIGLATAARYLEAGANVMLTSRTAEDLAAAAEGLDPGGNTGRVAWQAAHVGHPEDAESCVAATVERFGGLDILVNNAGTNPYFGPMLDIDVVRAQKTFEVNQLSVVVWTAAAVRAGLGRGGVASGSVINVASIGGLGVEPGIGWYNVTKAAVLHITRQLAYELAPNIRVNALAPGLVKTKLASALWEGPGRGADCGPHSPAALGAARRHRRRRAVPGLGCLVVDVGADHGDRRRDDAAAFGWGGLSRGLV